MIEYLNKLFNLELELFFLFKNQTRDLEKLDYSVMFRRQQTQQNKPNTGIKSFSSRVERRKKAAVEEKKEEPVQQVKNAIPKRTAKVEDLPVLKAGTELNGTFINSITVNTDNSIVITFKPLVGDYYISKGPNPGANTVYSIHLPEDGELWNLISGISGIENTAQLIFPSYQPTTIEGVEILEKFKIIYPGYTEEGGWNYANLNLYNGDTTAYKNFHITNSEDSSDVQITDLYLVNPDDSKTATEVFTLEDSEEKRFSKISGYTATTYTSNNKNHADIKNLHSTNYIIKKTGEESVENNLLVTGDIPPEVYDSLKLPFKLDESLNVLPSNTTNSVSYTIDSINAIPVPEGDSTVDDSSINLSGVKLGDGTNGQIDIRDKFDNFYVNNVTIKPDSANDIVTRFTQASGTGYLGSNVTIKAAGAGGSGEIVNDPLVPLIKEMKYENNTITFTIKPNEKEGLLVENRENAGTDSEESDHIIINLSDSILSNVLAEWDPSSTSGTTIAFIQEAIILNDEWNDSNKPDVRLNKGIDISEITIKYYKNGAVIENNLVSSPTEGDGKYKLDSVSSIVNKLYLVNGTVNDNRILTNPSVTFSGSLESPQITGLQRVDVLQDDVTVIEYYPTNMIVGNSENAVICNNIIVRGDIPDWTIDSTILGSDDAYAIKEKGQTVGEWTILALDSTETDTNTISTVNFLPVDGYGEELDIGVDFTTPATLGTETEPIELPEDNNGTKNELKLLNFNINEIYVKQNRPTADLDLTATVDHSYEGTTVHNAAEMEGVSGTASSFTDLISGFEVSGDALTIKIKPSNKKNILKDYRKGNDIDADKKEIILDITGNLNLCNKLTEKISNITISSVLIEQEALILDDSSIDNIPLEEGLDLTFKRVDITMNENVEISSLNFKYLKKGTDESYSEGGISFGTTAQINHKIDEFYFVHGIVSNKRLLEPRSAISTFTEDKKIVLEDVLVPFDAEQENGIGLLVENISVIENIHLTNIINGLEENVVGKSNVVVNGAIPKWAYDDFGKNGITVPATQASETQLATPEWTLSTVNDFPCSGYGELDIGINSTPPSTLDLRVPKSEEPTGDNNNGGDEQTENLYGKSGFYVDEVTLPIGVDEVNAQFTRHNELTTEGSNIQIINEGGDSPINPDEPTNIGYIKIKTLDQLYNLMMEPRTYVVNEGILFTTSTNRVEITSLVMEKDYYLFYSPILNRNTPRLLIEKQEKPEDSANWKPHKEDYALVKIMAENITDDQDTPENTNDDVVITRIYLTYEDAKGEHIIPYGVVGNGPFYGSELDPKYEVDGNKWNLKIEDIMKGINERQVNVNPLNEKLELSIESLTNEEKKIKKSEMYEYICEIKRTLNAMPFNSRYLNEILGYLSKCLAFEQVRLPSIRETDNQGLESVNEEYDAESNPNGWIEKYTEEFEKNGITYKVVSDYDNYRFKEGGKHDDLINEMGSRLAQIYMFNEFGDLNNLDLDDIMNKLVNGYIETWMKYYKGLVVPNDLIMSEYSDIEIYEDERIYKVFEGNSEEGTHVISQLTDGNINDKNDEELKTFIESIMKYFKDEINEITGTKKDIKGITIEDMVAYEDPMKETISVSAEQEGIDQALSNDENNLIEYSQMLSTIQGERNKLQRQGNKNKIILKFTQTVKGTFFELLGKEKMNTEQKSQIFGFFLSELKEIVSHIKKENKVIDRKSRRGVKSIQAIPEEIEGKRYLRITKVPEFYVGDPLDWINDNYYSNKIFLQNCDNLYVGIDPELDQRIESIGTPVNVGSSEVKEQEMIGYYILKIQY